jgi:TolB protein
MNDRTYKQVAVWVLAAAVAGASVGCARVARWVRGPEKKSPAVEVPPPQIAESTPALQLSRDVFAPEPIAPPHSPKVNIFGEFDGRPETGPVRPASSEAMQQHTFITEGADADVAIDPSGKWMVYASTRHSENANIYLQRVDGLSVTQLTSDLAEDAFPVFSPDGERIAFSSTRSGNWDIYVMDRDGKNVMQVTHGPMQDLHPSFSPDGTRLVYCSIGSRSNQWELWVVDLTTGANKMIGTGLFPRWSPNPQKDQIAFQRPRQRGSKWFSLWTLDLVNGESRRVTEVAVSSNAAVVSPNWSPDGSKLTFATILDPGKGDSGQRDIWIINADGSGRQRLTDGIATNLSPWWSKDGRVYFISDRSGAECVWSVRVPDGAGVGE